jgi:hypothetical protein
LIFLVSNRSADGADSRRCKRSGNIAIIGTATDVHQYLGSGSLEHVYYEALASVIVELKAMKAITGVGAAQLMNYLKATGLERGLLLNFGAPRLEFKRFVYSHPGKSEKPAEEDVSVNR